MVTAQPSVLPRSSDDDLTICPICGGYTQLYNGHIYCPNDKLIVSENPADALRAKVKFIKDEVLTIPKQRSEAKFKFASHILSLFFSFLFIIAMFIGGITGYEIIQANAYESQGRYESAQLAFEKSKFLITAPGVDKAIERMKHLVESSQNFELGEKAFTAGRYTEAVQYYALVDPQDKNYQVAQERLRTAEYRAKQQQPQQDQPQPQQ